MYGGDLMRSWYGLVGAALGVLCFWILIYVGYPAGVWFGVAGWVLLVGSMVYSLVYIFRWALKGKKGS